jgi:hypothetical protein
MSVKLDYNEGKREGVLTFPNGRTLKIENVTEEQARNFRDKNAAELEKRNLEFTTDGTLQKRG